MSKAPVFCWHLGLLLALVVSPAQVTFTEYPVTTANSGPNGITTGPDGNLWFTERAANKIGRITTLGVVTEFRLPTANSQPNEIVTGPDGNLWFTEYTGQQIGKMTPAGEFTEYAIPTANSYPYGITVGSDGNLWFTESGLASGGAPSVGGNKIGRITTAGVIKEFMITASDTVPDGIALGADGNVWFAEHRAGKIAKITPRG